MIPAIAIAVFACLGATAPLRAKETVVRLSWQEVRIVAAHAGFLSKVRVRTRVHGQQPIRGKLLEVTGTGLRIAIGSTERFLSRDRLHSFRLFPRKATHRRNRNIAAVAAAPVGFGTFLGTWAVACGAGACSESGGGAGALVIPAAFAVPYLIYRAAHKADRGSLLIVLEDRPQQELGSGSTPQQDRAP